MPVPCPTVNLELWKEYEAVAMHFNELLMQYRAQVAGGLAALVTLGGYIAEGKIQKEQERARFLAVTCCALAIVLTLVGCMDVFYYSRMVEVTVDEIIKLERHACDVRLSTTLRNAIGARGRYFATTLYLVAIFMLLLVGVSSVRTLWKHRAVTWRAE